MQILLNAILLLRSQSDSSGFVFLPFILSPERLHDLYLKVIIVCFFVFLLQLGKFTDLRAAVVLGGDR